MSDYLIKTLLAAILLGAAFAALLSMMARLGRPGDETRSEKLRRLHKRSGWVYVALVVPLAVFGADFLAEMGDGLSTRATFHFVLAAGLLAVLLLKLLIVKFYRHQLKFAPTLGLTIFALTLVIFLITAGFSVLQTAAAK